MVDRIEYGDGKAIRWKDMGDGTYAQVTTDSSLAQRFVSTADATIANTVIELSAFAAGEGSRTVLANSLKVGSIIRVRGGGVYSTPLVSGSVVVKAKLGGTVIATTSVSSLLVSQTNAAFNFSGVFVVRKIGVNGLIVPVGGFDFAGMNSTSRVFGDLVNGGTPVAINTTQDLLVDVTVQWSTASAQQVVKVTSATVAIEF